MTERLNYAKARRRDIKRAADHSARRPTGDGAERRGQLFDFTVRHNLACFKCGEHKAHIAKVGWHKLEPWAVCVDCVTKRSAGEG